MKARLVVSALLWVVYMAVGIPTALRGDVNISVALTATTHAEATSNQRELADTLLAFLELEISQQDDLGVVERRQIQPALHELALSEGLGADSKARLQLGKIAAADLIVFTRLLKAEQDQSSRVLVRITEPLTGVTRGATLTTIDEFNVDETARHITRYLLGVVRNPQQAGVTISVAPFESKARFGTIRPLELIIRDVLTAQLRQAGDFQVLQRTDLGMLIDELNFVRSGLVDRGQLPETLPSRHSLYHLTGTIDERYDNELLTIVCDAQLRKVSTNDVALEIKFESTQKGLGRALRMQAARIGMFMDGKPSVPGSESPPGGLDESDELFVLAMQDVQRLIRRRTYDYGYLPFRLPGGRQIPTRSLPYVEADSPTGDHLLQKSIDRLESVLYLHPEQRDVAYVLAHCYCFHRPGIWQPERAEQLLRNIFSPDDDSPLSVAALVLLAEMYVNHEGLGKIAPEHVRLVIDRMRFGIAQMPPTRGTRNVTDWVRMLTRIHREQNDYAGLWESIQSAARVAEQPDCPDRYPLCSSIVSAALDVYQKSKDEIIHTQVREMMKRWSEHDVAVLRHQGNRLLGTMAGDVDPSAAARYYVQAAEAVPLATVGHVHSLNTAAHYLLKANKPAEALDLLLKNEPQISPLEFTYGLYGLRLGQCYEALGQPSRALAVYLRSAESGSDITGSTDILARIERLGGVPQRENPDIAVRYINGPDEKPLLTRALASDGETLFCGALGLPWKQNVGVMAMDLQTRHVRPLDGMPHPVTCLACEAGLLWVGTSDEGLWRYDIKERQWAQWSTEDGLPTNTVVTLATQGVSVFASVGTVTSARKIVSGGVVRIGEDGQIEVLQGGEPPPVAPNSMVVTEDALTVAAYTRAYVWDFSKSCWKKPNVSKVLEVFRGESGIWASMSRKEVFQFHADDAHNGRYQAAWYPSNYPRSTYWPKFMIEHDGQLWFGGMPWREFQSSGFYRFDLKTNQLHMYGPRDGFRTRQHDRFTCYAGVFADGRIWVGTSLGLVEVMILRDNFAAGNAGSQKRISEPESPPMRSPPPGK
jgi:hypothetical protein